MQKTIIRKLNILLAIVLCAVLITGCTGKSAPWNGYSKQSFYFDTICEITILGFSESEGMDEEAFNKACDEVIADTFKLLSDYEKTLSRTVEGSDVDMINKAGGKSVKVSPETLDIIEYGLKIGDWSDGVFDITVGKASELWDFHESLTDEPASVPSEESLREASKHIDYSKIEVDKGACTVKLGDPEMMLDLGGIAKGYIADRTAEYLRSRGVASAIVNLGGNIEVVGGKSGAYDSADEEQADFSLGIRDPRSESGELLGIFPGKDLTVVTSGTYERFIEVDGVKYHHILDPKTGYPVDTDVAQVSIISNAGSSADCDGLSTACLALGSEKGAALIKSLNEQQDVGNGFLEAIFVTEDGKVIYTNDDTAFVEN